MNFNWSGEKFKNFHFDGQLLMSELKRHRGVLSWRMTYGFKNNISNLVNLHTSSWKEC